MPQKKNMPPLGPPNVSQRLCSRVVERDDAGSERLCGVQATVHIIYWWDETPDAGVAGFDHGFACDEHWADYQRRWSCAAHHPICHACGMPGSRISLDGCFMDDLPVAEPQRAVAVAETVA